MCGIAGLVDTTGRRSPDELAALVTAMRDTFVHRGPIFQRPVAFRRGETIVRDSRHYTDLLPGDEE